MENGIRHHAHFRLGVRWLLELWVPLVLRPATANEAKTRSAQNPACAGETYKLKRKKNSERGVEGNDHRKSKVATLWWPPGLVRFKPL